MSDVKWIKIVTDIFDDEKILLIESLPERDSIIVIWFKLLCMAGKQNNGGVFLLNDRIAYTDEMLSTIFRRPLNTVRLALQTFEQFGMVEIVNDTITIPNWEKHQSLELIEKNREKNRKKVAAFRERQRLLTSDGKRNDDVTGTVTVTGEVTKPNVTRTEREREGEGEREGDIEREKKKTAKRFTPPTVAEVRAYCQERQNNVDAERFVDYYTSNGWKVGKNAMKDWKAAVRTWERQGWNGYGYGGEKQQTKPNPNAADAYSTARLLELLDENE
jgi:predicted phage replisome organizer